MTTRPRCLAVSEGISISSAALLLSGTPSCLNRARIQSISCGVGGPPSDEMRWSISACPCVRYVICAETMRRLLVDEAGVWGSCDGTVPAMINEIKVSSQCPQTILKCEHNWSWQQKCTCRRWLVCGCWGGWSNAVVSGVTSGVQRT